MVKIADMLLLVKCYDNKMVLVTLHLCHLPVDPPSGGKPTKKLYFFGARVKLGFYPALQHRIASYSIVWASYIRRPKARPF